MNNSHGLISAIELNFLKYLSLSSLQCPSPAASTMPLDPSKHQDRRRLARDPISAVRQDGMFSREIEMKRNRGHTSCAECLCCVASHTHPHAVLILLMPLLDLRSSATSKSLVSPVR